MNECLSELQRYLFGLRRAGIKYTLDNIRCLLNALGNPQQAWPAIHIAGTNGKGSTAAFLEAALLKAGYRVGKYTSPHLVRVNERIVVNGRPAPDGLFIELTRRLRPTIETLQPSFFEVLTAMAFWYFKQQQVEIAVVETGMGGRLDATNVVTSLASVITSISLDHQQYLGNSLKAIAREKAGIIKPGIPCITSNTHPEVHNVLQARCKEIGSSLDVVADNGQWHVHSLELTGTTLSVQYGQWRFSNLRLGLAGKHQVENAMLALGTLYRLRNKIHVQPETIRDAFKKVNWPGRLQVLSTVPPVVLDVAHNPAGIERVLKFLKEQFPDRPLFALVALQRDKDAPAIARRLARRTKHVYVTGLTEGKPLKPQILADCIVRSGGRATLVETTHHGWQQLTRLAVGQNGVGLVTGSHFLAGDLLNIIQKG